MTLARSIRSIAPRSALLMAAMLATGALSLPAVAQADDAAFATTAFNGARALAVQEAELSVALTKVARDGRSAIPAARQATTATRDAAVLLALAINGQQTSSETGAAAKADLAAALKQEYRALGLVDRGLASATRGDKSAAKRLLAKATAGLKAAGSKAKKAGTEIRQILPPSAAG
jgi:hypothetical protein